MPGNDAALRRLHARLGTADGDLPRFLAYLVAAVQTVASHAGLGMLKLLDLSPVTVGGSDANPTGSSWRRVRFVRTPKVSTASSA